MSDLYTPKCLRDIPKKKRVNWKKELKLERGRVIDEAISKIREEIRNVPEDWKRGYYSAITKLEIMKDLDK